MKRGLLIAALGFAGGLAASVVGFRLRTVGADVPMANERLFYAGLLLEGSTPATGSRDIEVRFHSAATGTGNQICTSGLQVATPLVEGHFRINVGSACVTALATATNAYVEVVVGGVSLPPSTTARPKVAAVPYAAQASTATSLTSPLPAANVITIAGPSVEARLADLEARIVPPGTIAAFAGATAPPGWLICDGSAVSRTTFAALFAQIGVAWGAGDAVLTFNLPDLRGRFLRGVAGTSGNDPDVDLRTPSNAGGNSGNLVGTVQASALAGHAHSTPIHRMSYAAGGTTQGARQGDIGLGNNDFGSGGVIGAATSGRNQGSCRVNRHAASRTVLAAA